MNTHAHDVHTTLGEHILTDGLHHVIDFEKSQGSWLYDKASGQKYLDCFGQFASLALGYNHPSLLEAKDRLTNASMCKVVNSDLYSEEYASFVKALFGRALPNYFKYGFFIEGGALAVENCLKIAFDWKAKKEGLSDAQAQDLDVIHLRHAFHGRSGYTMSLTNTGPLKTDLFPRFNWTRIPSPARHLPNAIELERLAYEMIKHACRKGNVAAILVEPMQGEGGNNLFRTDFFLHLRKFANDYGALLIFDEVQTGFGGSGKWWCHEHYRHQPDLMAFGKKSQVCGVAATSRLDGVKDHCFKQSGRINSTWGGNIVDMVRAEIIIETIEKENLLQQATEVGAHLQNGLKELDLSNVRGLGTLVAFDMSSTEERDKMLSRLRKNMVILPCGDRSIRFRPALTFTQEDADQAIEFIRKVVDELH